ncbi:hypothetical protein Q7Y45_08905 [Glaesserella parasuis]|nr:hypothetical protein [Glaesserella parasuis]
MNQDYKLPPRKWYTLEQAIKRIKQLTGEELEIADLIHYWKIRKLEICTYCLMTPVKITIGNTILNNNGFSLFIYYDHRKENEFKYKIKDVLEFVKLDERGNEYNYETTEYNHITNIEEHYNPAYYITERAVTEDEMHGEGVFYIHGLLSVIPQNGINIIKEVSFDSNIIQFVTPKNNENDYRIGLEIVNFDDEIYLDKNQLYILNDDLEDFINNKANPPIPEQYKHPPTKTLNAQAEFIRNLLIMFYDETTANNIRKELDNPNSEIRKDFEQKGLPTPSGKTVDRWINQP